MALANSDSCSVSHYNNIEKPKIKKEPINEKNPVNILLATFYGY
jgi:hypothetical protein